MELITNFNNIKVNKAAENVFSPEQIQQIEDERQKNKRKSGVSFGLGRSA